MNFPRRIRLVLALVSFASVTGLLIATLSTGEASQPKLKSKLLRSKDRLSAPLDEKDLDWLRKHALQDEKKAEREFENKIPSHLPIKVKVKADKEKAAKALANDRWHRDLELEVTNTGDKPIYYLFFILEFPEFKVGDGNATLGFWYGTHSLFDDSKGRAAADDIPFNPQTTLILKLAQPEVVAWEQWKERQKWPQPRKLIIEFYELNFGDGTGFWSRAGSPWPLPKELRRPRDAYAETDSAAHGHIRTHHAASDRATKLFSMMIGGEPANLGPASFRFGGENYIQTANLEREAVPETSCCPGSCWFVYVYNWKTATTVAHFLMRMK